MRVGAVDAGSGGPGPAILRPVMASDRATLNVEERTDFGSRTSRRLRRDGLVPGHRLRGRQRAAPIPGARAGRADRPPARRRADRRRLRRLQPHARRRQGAAARPGPRAAHPPRPARGQARRGDRGGGGRSSFWAPRRPPASRREACSSTSPTRSRSSALPTEIPESIPADVSGMAIGDTLQLSAISRAARASSSLGRGASDEVTIATLSPPRVEEEPEPELEEEAELIGEEGEVPEGEEAEGEGEARGRGRRLRRLRRGGVAPCRCSTAPPRSRRGRGRIPGGGRVLVVGLGNPEAATRRPATTSGSRSPPSSRDAGSCRGPQALPRADHGGPRRPGRPAGRGAAAADLHERVGRRPRAGSRSPQGPARARWSRCTTRSTCPFGEVRSKLGGGVAGHNGLKSLADGLGGRDFWRVRAGVGRPGLDRPRDRLRLRALAASPSRTRRCAS